MVGDGVGHQPHPGVRRDLLHDLRLTDARRPHQQHRSLPDGGDQIVPQLVFRQIGTKRVFDLLLRLLDIHRHIYYLLIMSILVIWLSLFSASHMLLIANISD